MKLFVFVLMTILISHDVSTQTMNVHTIKGDSIIISLNDIEKITFGSVTQPPQSGLVAYYSFNGNSNDLSGSGNHGVASKDLVYTVDRFMKDRKAVNFDNGARIVCPTNGIPVLGHARSISLWFKPRNYTNSYWLLGWGSSSVAEMCAIATGINGGPSPRPRVGLWSYGDDIQSASTLSTDWQHVVFTFDGSVARLYVNAQLASSKVMTLSTPSAQQFYMGSHPTVLEFAGFPGDMDDVRIYDRKLEVDEVTQLYHEDSWPF